MAICKVSGDFIHGCITIYMRLPVGTGGAGGHGKEGGGAGAGGEVKITEELPHQIVEKNEHIVRFMPSGY